MKEENKKKKYKCQTCGKEYTENDFLFKSFFNPYNCDDCERSYREETSDD